MMSEGKRPLSVGFFFSLGHSTIVFSLAFLLSIGVKALSGPVQHDQSTLHKATNVIGTTVSGSFLYLIAILNMVVLVSIVRIFFEMRRGAYDEQALEAQLNSRGFMNRFFGGRLNAIRQPWQMYPVGVLFGLGFDTATEVALLVLAAGAGAAGLPFYAILCLPILFAAGMSLLDTIDGSFMNFAYGWTFSKPVRKVYYNITITGLSVAVALFIGTIELVGLLTDKLGLHGAVADWFQNFNINSAGFVIVGMFVATWAVALAVWRFARIEERWSVSGPARPDDGARVGTAAELH
jgi:nickel/cobalt transporter (NiCoT) family protein